MIATSTTQTIPFTPQWLLGKVNAPVFHLRASSVIERAQMEAELSGQYRAARVFGFELKQAMRDGVAKLLADDPELDRVLGAIEAEGDADAEALSPEDEQMLGEVRGVLEEHWPPYCDLIAQMQRRREIAPIVALRRFCVGWEHCSNDQDMPAVFARGFDGLVTDAALGGLKHLELMVAGNRAYELQYAAGQEGNSSRPDASVNGQATSGSDDTSKEDGKSTGDAGTKTPASRSRRKSGR